MDTPSTLKVSSSASLRGNSESTPGKMVSTPAASSSSSSSELAPHLKALTDGNPAQASKNAYVTLIAGMDQRFKYRGFLYNAIIMRKALREKGSTADFIAMLGLSDSTKEGIESMRTDVDLLKSHGIIVYVLPRLIHDSHPFNFAEMALLKITPYSFVQYDRIQFYDGDIMPTRNMDCFFALNDNTFTLGAVSPLNSGWFLALPSTQSFESMRERAVWRLSRDWDKVQGWGVPMPKGMTYRGGRSVKEWLFNGADMDQGLLCHHFVLNQGHAVLIDTVTQEARRYKRGFLHEAPEKISLQSAVGSCQYTNPVQYYAHFTGRSKPWVVLSGDKAKAPRKGSALDTWVRHLDALQLPVTSANIKSLNFASPLGYFNARFPKGGYKKDGKT